MGILEYIMIYDVDPARPTGVRRSIHEARSDPGSPPGSSADTLTEYGLVPLADGYRSEIIDNFNANLSRHPFRVPRHIGHTKDVSLE